jgi:hypothetical protein
MKNLSIAKLRQLCFGNQNESARHVCGKAPKEKQKTRIKGHGRHSHLANRQGDDRAGASLEHSQGAGIDPRWRRREIQDGRMGKQDGAGGLIPELLSIMNQAVEPVGRGVFFSVSS